MRTPEYPSLSSSSQVHPSHDSAEGLVPTRPWHDRVPPLPAADEVVAAAAKDRVVPAEPRDRVGARRADQLLAARGADDRRAARPTPLVAGLPQEAEAHVPA